MPKFFFVVLNVCKSFLHQYAERARIFRHCRTLDSVFASDDMSRLRHVKKHSIIYAPRYGVSYCQIAKVASGTWCMHFAKLPLALASFRFRKGHRRLELSEKAKP